ncbi:efflux RND transporter periplasmic adaptor subunit [Pseudoalteromonas denitrificans]|uniref:RND family efflux transporter, MFP subunit n=1 Tax=Pseudoalteromonas denitrificans DSM 6059 TaxID=1123010 RepID=A0A1I1KMB4_9GAMM|nr:efflux RND transporter periplasmic adaptor subunit [Pseudoalteromonas denitrificans]SFC61841.1 RND family efflux transporter, MFP subunit [Pseudoalteromonas denitrificans DSM 6059]
MRASFILLTCAFILGGCSKPEKVSEQVIRPIAWTQVKLSNLDQVRRLSGIIQPVEATNLSFQVGGKVDAVSVKLGDAVKRGDFLAKLDKRSFVFSQQSSQANLQKAQSALVEAKNEFERYTELSEKGLVSKSGFDNAQAAFKTASSAVNLAKTQLDISTKDLNDSQLKAPYNGRITKRSIEPSMQITPGQTVFEIEGEDGLEVQIMIPETLIRDLSTGNKMRIHYPAFPNLNGEGTVTEIGTRARTANAFPVTVLIDTSITGLRAGMTAEVDFTFVGVGRTGYRGQAFRLPLSALGAGAGQSSYVFVYNEKNQTISKRVVQTENIINNKVMVSSGLKADEIIATAGVSFLREGQNVRLLDKHVKQFN